MYYFLSTISFSIMKHEVPIFIITNDILCNLYNLWNLQTCLLFIVNIFIQYQCNFIMRLNILFTSMLVFKELIQ